MDSIELSEDNNLSAIQDWIIQSWMAFEPNKYYSEALTSVIRGIWPKSEITSTTRKPSFILLPTICSHILGCFSHEVLEVNGAWAILYIVSYLLDKVEDQETNHVLFRNQGLGVVTNVTTGLIFHAQRILLELGTDTHLDQDTLDTIRFVFNQQAVEICAGQHMDLSQEEPSLNEVWKIVDEKSGKFFALGAYLGARMATNDPAVLEIISMIGRKLGIMIQIANDIHGLGEDAIAGSDLSMKKRTLAVAYALHVLPSDKRMQLTKQLNAAPMNKNAEAEARNAILKSGAILYLTLEAERHKYQAKKMLNQLNRCTESTSYLINLLDYAMPAKTFFVRNGAN